jgi:predicted amidohydrolase YtcJ
MWSSQRLIPDRFRCFASAGESSPKGKRFGAFLLIVGWSFTSAAAVHAHGVSDTYRAISSPEQESPASSSGPADSIVRNASIYTMNPDQPWADTLVIAAGKIVAVERGASIDQWSGPQTEIIDAGGRLVLPGLHDLHAHIIPGQLLRQSQCELPGTLNSATGTSKALIEASLRACAERLGKTPGFDPGDWVLGGGFSISVYDDRVADKVLLDEIFPDNPVFLVEEGVHLAWVNSLALEIAGIDATTQQPHFGEIVKGEDGQPIGTLRDYAAMELVGRMAPSPSLLQRLEAAQAAIADWHALGFTSLTEAGTTEADLLAFHRLARDGLLNVNLMTSLIAARSGVDDDAVPDARTLRATADRFRLPGLNTSGVKIWLDGGIEMDSAAWIGHSSRHPWQYGNLVISPSKLTEFSRNADSEGLQLKIHAIGDAAAQAAITSLVEARRTSQHPPATEPRHHLAHATAVIERDMERMGRWRIGADVQLQFSSDSAFIRDDVIRAVGEHYYRNKIMQWRTLLEQGVLLGYGSDWPVSPRNPFWAMAIGATRKDPVETELPPLDKGQRLTLAEMLPLFTINAATIMQQADRTGSLEPGKDADFIVIDRNIFERPLDELWETKVLTTVFRGKPVYHHPDSPYLQSLELIERPGYWR